MRRDTFLKLSAILPYSLSHIINHIGLNKMISRPIRSTNEMLPIIGLGTWRQFDISLNNTEKESLNQVLKTLYDHGGRVIDTSPMYNRSESVIGKLTKPLAERNEFFYATKIWTTGEDEGIKQMTNSFRMMGRQQMDLMQIHNLMDWKTHLKSLRKWKEEGKIRYIGLTHYTISAHEELEKIIKYEKDIDFIQINYNIYDRHAERSLLQTAHDNNVSVLINRPFEGGELFRFVKSIPLPEYAGIYGIKSWGQFFLKYIISNPHVTCVIPGTSNPKHILDNVQAGYGEMPDERMRRKMRDIFS